MSLVGLGSVPVASLNATGADVAYDSRWVIPCVCSVDSGEQFGSSTSVAVGSSTHSNRTPGERVLNTWLNPAVARITHANLPALTRKTMRMPSKLHSTPPVACPVMFLPRPFRRSGRRTRLALASITSDTVATAGSQMQRRQSMLLHSGPRLMKPSPGTLVSKLVQRCVKGNLPRLLSASGR